MVNHYFQSGVPMGRNSEQLLVEDLVIECLKIYGFDVYYLPRQEVNLDKIFTEDPLNKFDSSFMVEMYMKNVSGFEGDGDLMSKFGVEIRDTATFLMARRRWDELIGRSSKAVLPERPAEGDVIFFPLTNSFFEIKRVEALNPFFQVGKLYTFELQCELMQASSERFETGIDIIDSISGEKSMSSDFNIRLEDDSGSLLLEYETPSAILQEDFDIESNDKQAQNDMFNDEILGILDFSEKNPFGEII